MLKYPGLVWNELKSSEDEEAIVANKISINFFLQHFLRNMKGKLQIRMPRRNQLTNYYNTSESAGVNLTRS